MATKRKSTANRRAGGKPAAQRRKQGARRRRPARRGARAGARESRRAQLARQVERDAVGAAEAVGHGPELEAAPANEPAWAAEGEGVPGYARLVAAAEEATGVLRREEAEAELSRRREEAERSAATGEPTVPTMRDIAVELAIGSMRLVRTLATAPLRIGLAFLREG